MAAIGGKNTIWKTGTHGALTSLTDYSTNIQSCDAAYDQAPLKSTVFRKTAETYELGLKDGKITVQYLYTPTMYAVLQAIFNASEKVSFERGIDGSTTGNPKETGTVFLLGLPTTVKVGELQLINVTFQCDDAVTFTAY